VKSGGFTPTHGCGSHANPSEPEKLTAYEVGIKSDLTQTVRVDAAAFYYRYKGQQVLGKVLDGVLRLLCR